jgi:hypothetical protein
MAVELKLSVLASGEIALDGEPVTLPILDTRLRAARQQHPECTVLYYRESTDAAPPRESIEVIKTIVKHALPVSLCAQPDFSDYVDRFGQSRPRSQKRTEEEQLDPHAPDVFPDANLDQIFDAARERARSAGQQRGIVIVRPDRGMIAVATSPSPTIRDSIAVIANTAFTLFDPDADLNPAQLKRAIPFFDKLAAHSAQGQSIWIFEGHPDALTPGCRDADQLIVDSGMVPFLTPNWKDLATAAMRRPEVVIYDR